MDKTIISLSRRPFTVQLEDRPCSVFVSGRDGKILIDEGGDGDDRLNGAVLYADQGPRFTLRERAVGDSGDSLRLECGTFSLCLGALPVNIDARTWVDDVNAFLAAKNGVPRGAKPPAFPSARPVNSAANGDSSPSDGLVRDSERIA